MTPDQVQALAERCEWAQLENRNTGWSRLERTPYGYQHAIELRLGWGWCVAASQRLDPSRHGEYRFYAYLQEVEAEGATPDDLETRKREPQR